MKKMLLFVWFASSAITVSAQTENGETGPYKRFCDSRDAFGFKDLQGNILINPEKYMFLNPMDEEGMILARNRAGKYGFIDIYENTVIPFEYEDMGPFSEGLAPAGRYGKYGYIDRKGQVAIPFRYDSKHYFCKDGTALAGQNGKYGLIGTDGREIVPIKYEAGLHVWDNDNAIAAFKEGGKWAFFSSGGEQLSEFVFDTVYYRDVNAFAAWPALVAENGKPAFYNEKMERIVAPGTYDEAEPFGKDGKAIVKKENKYGMIDARGKPVLAIAYDRVARPRGYPGAGNLYVTEKEGEMRLLDKNLRDIIPPGIFAYRYEYETLLVKRKDGKAGGLTREGKIVLPFVYDTLAPFVRDTLIACRDGKYALVTAGGEPVTPFRYEMLRPVLLQPYAFATKNGKTGMIDTKGNTIIPFEYDAIYRPPYCDDFSPQRFVIVKNGKTGTIDKNNRTVIAPVYDALSGWVERGPNAHYARKDGRYGLISRNGEILVPIRYEYIRYHAYQCIVVRENGKYGILDMKNETIAPCKYDYAFPDIEQNRFVLSGEDGRPADRTPHENRLVVKQGERWRYLNLYGKIIRDDVPFAEIRERYAYQIKSMADRPDETRDYNFIEAK